ncbi:unnamed protein product [Anisakis simplex]|uniref:Clc-like protein 5 (inferred by orthology to a C. elegans protein) n=1 Tax=Anisakis simplex TaxID=6269 RepID=A0A0M3IY73_ANISI|nr:unnamed protein product [Anisakis simplex]
MLFDWSNRLVKAQIVAFALICFSNLLAFIAMVTPAWQVAKDLDAGVYVQSGLWLYCPGASQCWYIFNDDSANYYERVDVCRFFLIGDCRKKLLRTPYFFGWHKAVLTLMIFALLFGSIAAIAIALSTYRRNYARLLTVTFNGFAFLSFMFLSIALAVFVINAEMLEARYLIGVKNTFRKEYGYSFYLAAFATLCLLFAQLAGVLVTTFVFFAKDSHEHSVVPGADDHEIWQRNQLYALKKMRDAQLQSSRISSNSAIPVFEQQVFDQPPRPGSVLGGSQTITSLSPAADYWQSRRANNHY